MKSVSKTLTAAGFIVAACGIGSTVSAMPMSPAAQDSASTPKIEQVRLVCNVYGRCYRRGYYRYYGGGPYYGRPYYYGPSVGVGPFRFGY